MHDDFAETSKKKNPEANAPEIGVVVLDEWVARLDLGDRTVRKPPADVLQSHIAINKFIMSV